MKTAFGIFCFFLFSFQFTINRCVSNALKSARKIFPLMSAAHRPRAREMHRENVLNNGDHPQQGP